MTTIAQVRDHAETLLGNFRRSPGVETLIALLRDMGTVGLYLYTTGQYRRLDDVCRMALAVEPRVATLYEFISAAWFFGGWKAGDSYSLRRRVRFIEPASWRRDSTAAGTLLGSSLPPERVEAELTGLIEAGNPYAVFERFQALLAAGKAEAALDLLAAARRAGVEDARIPAAEAVARRIRDGDTEATLTMFGRPFRYWFAGRCPDLDIQMQQHLDAEAERGSAFSPIWFEHLPVLQQVVKPGSFAIDVGANVGIVSVFFAGFCGARRVLAIEANPATAEILERHLAWNAAGLPIETGIYAVGRETGSVRFSSGFATLGARFVEGGAASGIEVPLKRLDDVVDEPPDFIKIDVEGNEIDVLLGAVTILRRHRPLIFSEAWQRHKQRLVDFMAAFEYRLVKELRQDLLLAPVERMPTLEG